METGMWLQENLGLILLITLWTLPWKGVALWKAARFSHKGWFVALLVINSLAILEIIYIFLIAKNYHVEVISDEKKK